ncbi:acyl-CoA dehydrogenase mitochondrial precursor [Perkinsela sp. CCAP 1560/4]|nr:acyl-CoA dehydrogenase mitochondrial precursor [Perkinsela sp. CCAP 1560/4]|eukprot:KNH06350.1 acyl-CoA dehydrogenase mitochondrial precursor [Perkinsela sp. CCAP 1560/4]
MKNFIREKIHHCTRLQLHVSLRRVGTYEKPIFWTVGEKELFPYVIPSQNQKESTESASILDSFSQELQKKTDLSAYIRGNASLLSTCIPSQFGGSDHSVASKVKLIEQLEFLITQSKLGENGPQSYPPSLYSYYMLYAPSCYFQSAQEITAQESMEKLHTDIRQGKAVCTVCHSIIPQKSIRMEPTTGDRGKYIASGEFHGVPFANSATHFIFIAEVQSTVAVEEAENDQPPAPEWKSVVCIAEKNTNMTVEKEANSSALGERFKVRLDGVEIAASRSFLCDPGKAVELENRAKSSLAILRCATVLGRLHAMYNSMRTVCSNDTDLAEKNFVVRFASYLYALESVLHIAAIESESGDVVLSAVLRVMLQNVLHELLDFADLSQANVPRMTKIRALIEESMTIAASGESVSTVEHFLACLALEQSACEINATSTLDMMQQRALNSLGVRKRTLNLRQAVDKVKNTAAGVKKPAWLKPFEKHLTELEGSMDAFQTFTEAFLTKSGVYISDMEYQALSECMNIQVELFARYCVLSRAFASLKSSTTGEQTVRLLESYCALSEAKVKQHAALFDNQKSEDRNPMQAISLDRKIFDDLVCMEARAT